MTQGRPIARDDIESFASPSRRLQLIGTRGGICDSLVGGAGTQPDGGAINLTNSDGRWRSRLANVAVSDLQIAYGGFYLESANGGVETAVPNSFKVQAAVEFDSGFSVNPIVANFQAVQQFTIPTKSIVLTDPIGVDVAANTGIFIRTNGKVDNVGEQWPANYGNAVSGENMIRNTSASVFASSGTISGTQMSGLIPLAVLGVPQTPVPAVALIIDSKGNGTGDSNPGGVAPIGDGSNYGFLTRGLYNAPIDGASLPWVKLGRGSATAFAFNSGYSPLQWSLLNYCTHAIVQRVYNDVANGSFSAAQVQATLTKLWTGLKRRNLKVYQCLCGPRTTSNDSWATAAGQTGYFTGYEPGGKRDVVNTWIKAQVGLGLLDGYIDVNSVLEDPANPGKWVTNGAANYMTADGIHESYVGHLAQAAIVNTLAKTFEVNPITGLAA